MSVPENRIPQRHARKVLVHHLTSGLEAWVWTVDSREYLASGAWGLGPAPAPDVTGAARGTTEPLEGIR